MLHPAELTYNPPAHYTTPHLISRAAHCHHHITANTATSKMTARVSSSMQMIAITDCQALNNALLESTSMRTKVCKDEQMYLLKCVVYSTEQPCSTRNTKQWSRSHPRWPSPPQLSPQPLVLHPEPPNDAATLLSTMAMTSEPYGQKTTTWVSTSTQMAAP